MTIPQTKASSAEVTVIDNHARWPVLLLICAALVWLVGSGVLALIAAIQLHSPAFFSDCAWFTHGRMRAMSETSFVYGWAANAGLATALWILGRLGGHPLRALNWAVVGTAFWNLGVAAGVVGIATGDMTSFSLLQLPRYVQPLLVLAYAAIAMAGVLAWSGRKRDGTFAAQWYAVAALFLFPWLLTAAQVVLLWSPVRGVVQSIGAAWFADGAYSLWLVPLALAGAYYIVPKASGRALPSYEAAPLAFWLLIIVGTWTGGRHLVGGPVPAWVPTMAVVGYSMLLYHYVVVALNLRVAFGAAGTAVKFVQFGLVAYLLGGLWAFAMAFRSVAMQVQFTFVTAAHEQLSLYGAVSMMFFGAIYFMVPRLTGRAWASGALVSGHLVAVMLGVLGSVAALALAGAVQSSMLADAKTPLPEILLQMRTPLLLHSASQLLLLAASLLLLVNFCRTACACGEQPAVASENLFRRPAGMEGTVS